EAALASLKQRELLYPCFCTRASIAAEIQASAGAPQGPDGSIYPGICRDLGKTEREARMARGENYAWRLDVARAVAAVGRDLSFDELGQGPNGESGRIVVTPHIA